MSASREKKARQELNESGYVDPRKAREAEEKAKERRSTRIYTAVIVAFVLLGVVLFASGRIQASNEAKETARIGAESAVTIDGEDFSVNDVAYYYGSIYNTFANNGSSFGFDSSKSAREQQYTEGKTWHDYFLESALDYMKESVAIAHAAEAAGFDGTEQMDSSEQSNLSMVDLYASYSGATRAQYLTAMFGKYMTEEAFVRCVRRDALASAYRQSYSDSLTYSAADLQAAYTRRMKAIADMVRPVMERVYEDRKGQLDTNIYFPITDGHLGYNVPVNLQRCKDSDGEEIFKVFSKVVMFTTIDDAWREHLREMDDLRQSVQNATYEQKDPLLIYKLESFQLFSKMLNKVNADVLSTLNKAYIPVRENTAENVQRERQERAKVDVNKLQASRMQAAAQAGQAEKQKPMPVHVEKKAGRNDPCPCGSGKKYKNCHGKGL